MGHPTSERLKGGQAVAFSGIEWHPIYWIICQARKLRLVAQRAGEVHKKYAGMQVCKHEGVQGVQGLCRRPAQQVSSSLMIGFFWLRWARREIEISWWSDDPGGAGKGKHAPTF